MAQQQAASSASQAQAAAELAPDQASGARATQGASSGRRSLQEEASAYLSWRAHQQADAGQEEARIRSKFSWFPPALNRLAQVEQFFAQFPEEKIPYAPGASSSTEPGQLLLQRSDSRSASSSESSASSSASSSLSSSLSSSPGSDEAHWPTTTATSTTADAAKRKRRAASEEKQRKSVEAAVGPSSHRDEQIAFQLPRQDVSLDYCSYPLGEQARQAYAQFVERRNTQALDVASVVEVRANSFVAAPGATSGAQPNAAHSQSGWNTPRLEQGRQRKASTVSQSAVALLALSQSQQEQLLGQQASGCSGAQRCRRCLVRFESGQLAVVAPKFTMGAALYRAPNASGAPAGQGAGNQLRQSANSQASANAALFHAACFTCSTCKEFLVDLVYCLRDNKLYCLRHYGDSLRPRCSWCQELIFSDEYLRAMNESFHVDHFLCRHCDANLAGLRYVLKEEKPYCIQCYENNFANVCEDCQKAIGIDSRDLSYKDRHWHDTCFLCNKCHESLIDKPFGSKADKVYCADCYDVTFATRCDGCKNPFRAGIKCYEDKFATKCTKCKLVIVSGGVTFRNEPWHRDCFNCCNCNKSLAGQRFTTRDVQNETVKDTNKTNQPHNAYCIDCYGELFAKKCYACSQAITGLGGTRFVTFEDRSWHNDCFICNDCNTSLVGKGFITDGPETILCGDCARAKLR